MNDDVIAALHREHREQLGKMQMQLVLYREALEKAGIEPPDRDGEELLRLWRASARVIADAADLLHVYGTSKELVLENMAERVVPMRRPA